MPDVLAGDSRKIFLAGWSRNRMSGLDWTQEAEMTRDRLKELHEAGQSIWLDNIDRTMLHNGDLERRIKHECLTGMTSNPTIFEKALAQGTAYDEQLGGAEPGLSTAQLFELVETEDVRRACDLFAGVFTNTRGDDGCCRITIRRKIWESLSEGVF